MRKKNKYRYRYAVCAAMLLLLYGGILMGYNGLGVKNDGSENETEQSESAEEDLQEQVTPLPEPTATAPPTAKPTDELTEEDIARRRRIRDLVPLPIEEPTKSVEEIKKLSLVISKTEYTLTMYDKKKEIAKYSLHAIGKNPEGTKEKEGDKKTPEGEYYICYLNGNSQYHLALGLSYPNAEDAKRGYEKGLISEWEMNSIIYANENGYKPNWYTALGGEIMIHGIEENPDPDKTWTSGCIAVENEVMDILWRYCKIGTKVIINE